MSSPNVAYTRSRAIPISSELVPSLPGSLANSRANSRANTPAASTSGSCLLNSPFAVHKAIDLNYSFINSDFIDEDVAAGLIPGSSVGSLAAPPHTAATTETTVFRNLTSTPRHSHPLSLPKSLPIDWKLFNKQYELQQRRRQSRLKRKHEEFENTFENLPYPVIDFIADCVESQNDLISLSQTCTFFNKMVNRRLYSKLIFVDNISDKCMHYDGDYTLVDAKNYPKLLASLHANEDLIQIIKEIIIDTSSNNSSYDSIHENIYAGLYDLFLTTNNNLKILENLDFNNLKKFNSLIHYNRDHLIKHNYNKYTYYYHSSENMENLIRNDLLHLKNYQLLDLNDINMLPLTVNSVSVAMEHEYLSHDPLRLEFAGLKVLENLHTLKLHTVVATELFISGMYKLFTDPTSSLKVSRLQNIRTLSISSIHLPEDQTQHSLLSFEKLNTIIDLAQVEELELKTKCLDHINCNSCLMRFLVEWYNELIQNGESRLKKLSIISLPPNANQNVNIQWDYILSNGEFLQKFGENLEFFFINLNDFPFVPIFEKTQALEVHDHQKLPMNSDILKLRKLMYTSILDSFKKLELFVIPDYFYNWAVYNNIHDLSNDEHLNFLNFLDNCHCITCCETRTIFKQYASQHQFKDFKGRFKTDLKYGPRNPANSINRYNKLNDDPDAYRILYNTMLRELKSRIPLKQLNKVQSSLDYDKFVPNVRAGGSVIPETDFARFTKLFAHGLRPDIQRILDTLPMVKKFNLGGMLFKCHPINGAEVRVHAVYDDFCEVFMRKVK
ncbi:CYFA0S02e08746g1_1 [Cyberlindnera fabianii]|uniref:CYFA0S02e08746g1_1 n=1 Tax=Cyberlindnera fabianii TaxID=36022 RepID=A0A061AMV2_CYBFA|nr:CYFA0S02e08746g1_1 [Cyberlindnera fabianii]